MTHKRPITTARRLGSSWWEMLFFGVFILYLWVQVNPALQHQEAQPVFFTGMTFLSEYLYRPGGLVDYASAFFLECSQFTWLGAILGTMLAWLTGRAIKIFLAKTTAAPIIAAHLLPVLLLLLLQNRYDSRVVGTGLGLLLAAGVAAIYVAIPYGGIWRRALMLGVSLGALYWIAGLGPAMLCALWAAAADLLNKRWLAGFGGALAGCLLGVIVLVLIGTTPGKAFRSWGSGYLLVTTVTFGLLIPLIALVLAGLRRWAPPPESIGHHHRPAKVSWTTRGLGLGHSAKFKSAFILCWFLAGAGCLYLSFDQARKQLLQIEWLAEQGNWPQILKVAAVLPKPTPAERLQVLRALYHTGRLPEAMFAFAQVKDDELLPGMEIGLSHGRALSATLFELGQVNLAEHWAHEFLENDGEHPETLQLLAKINILKGRVQAARIFLNLLKKSPFHRRWAEGYLRILETDPPMAQTEEIARLRSVMVKTDAASSSAASADLLQQLLHTNEKNQMAFEYLMAHYLFTHQVDKFAQSLGRLNNFSYSAIPRHYEEAILLYRRLYQSWPPNLPGTKIREETQRRYAEFEDTVRRNRQNLPAIQPTLAREFGDTYWFYYLFGYSPGKAPVTDPERKT